MGQAGGERWFAGAEIAQEVEECNGDADGRSKDEAAELNEQRGKEGEAEEETEEVRVEEDFAPVSAVADVCSLFEWRGLSCFIEVLEGGRRREGEHTSVYTPITAPKNWATKRMTRPAVKEEVEAFFGAPSERSAPYILCQPAIVITVSSFPSALPTAIPPHSAEPQTHLLTRIRPRSHQNPNRQPQNAQHLHTSIPLPNPPAHNKGNDAPKTAQDNVHRHADIECKGPVIEEIDETEEDRGCEEASVWYAWCAELVGEEEA